MSSIHKKTACLPDLANSSKGSSSSSRNCSCWAIFSGVPLFPVQIPLFAVAFLAVLGMHSLGLDSARFPSSHKFLTLSFPTVRTFLESRTKTRILQPRFPIQLLSTGVSRPGLTNPDSSQDSGLIRTLICLQRFLFLNNSPKIARSLLEGKMHLTSNPFYRFIRLKDRLPMFSSHR